MMLRLLLLLLLLMLLMLMMRDGLQALAELTDLLLEPIILLLQCRELLLGHGLFHWG